MQQRNTELNSLKLRTSRLEVWLRFSICTWLLTIGGGTFWFVTSQTHAQQQPAEPGVLRVTEIVVSDKNGVERVRIGGDLPDALIGGRRIPEVSKLRESYYTTLQAESGAAMLPSNHLGM
jgi:hypothetical protein